MTTKPNSGTVSVSRELLEKALASSDEQTSAFVDESNGPGYWSCHACGDYCNPSWNGGRIVSGGPDSIAHEVDCWAEELRAILAQPADQQGEPVARMPVERCYDVRAKMIIAFNEAKKAGGDLDDQLDAAYKSALRFSPNPDAQPATAKVVLPRRLSQDDGFSYEAAEWFNACLDEVARLNGIET